jgi:hypothetical protein
MWYICEAASAMGWRIEDIAEENVAKLQTRYPEGFEADRSLHRY